MAHEQRQLTWNDEWTQLTVIVGPNGIIQMELEWSGKEKNHQEPGQEPQQEKKPKFSIKRPQVQIKSCYSAEEISLLSDARLLKCFIAIKGVTELYCSHCRRYTPIETQRMYSIRKRSTKHGLYPDTAIPKTCDVQLKRNEICNPINNIAYNTVRRANVSDEIKRGLFHWRMAHMEEIGIQTRPRIYHV